MAYGPKNKPSNFRSNSNRVMVGVGLIPRNSDLTLDGFRKLPKTALFRTISVLLPRTLL